MCLFDYKGFDETILLKLCSDLNVKLLPARWKYWPSEIYSNGNHIRDYGYYPSFLPLYCYTMHGSGVSSLQKPAMHELNNDAHVQFYSSKVAVDNFKKFSDKQCYCIMHPWVWYRRKYSIDKIQNAQGLLAFPAHSTPTVEIEADFEKYSDKLLDLPKKYFPIAVCLHMHDINKGLHRLFLRKGIPVYTAGNARDIRFAQRWYEIVRHYAFTSSNTVSSSAYYCIEMGIPFFIYGDKPSAFINLGDPNLPEGRHAYGEYLEYMIIHNMFSTVSDTITPEQHAFAEKHLGVNDGISRAELSKILYTAYLRQGNFIKDLCYSCCPQILIPYLKRIFATARNIKSRIFAIKGA